MQTQNKKIEPLLFGKGDESDHVKMPQNENVTFLLKLDGIEIGTLHCEHGEWVFSYSKEFKETYKDEYNRIIGFPELDKVYKGYNLWPFFKIRIPGLKQPAVKEILAKEKIDEHNEVALLRRFGRKTIANSYELEVL